MECIDSLTSVNFMTMRLSKETQCMRKKRTVKKMEGYEHPCTCFRHNGGILIQAHLRFLTKTFMRVKCQVRKSRYVQQVLQLHRAWYSPSKIRIAIKESSHRTPRLQLNYWSAMLNMPKLQGPRRHFKFETELVNALQLLLNIMKINVYTKRHS